MPVELTAEERQLLVAGLNEWGGPAAPTDELAAALGFGDVPGLLAGTRRLSNHLADGETLPSHDLVRALVATEVAFASDFFGSGVEWSTTTGLSDEQTVATLRRLQRKLAGEHPARLQ